VATALPFTLVTTVFNEAARLPQTLADLDRQTLHPGEVIIVDAGSTDGTLNILESWAERCSYPVRVHRMVGANIAQGRNKAIEFANYELIVSTDFGCRYKPEWLANLTAPFQDKAIQVSGGVFAILENEVVTAAAKADYLLQRGYEVDTSDYFSVSSRSIAYYKRVWSELGKYQEWLTLAADDTIFWRQIKREGVRYALGSTADVLWMRHSTLSGFAKEAYRYGLGDGESGINRRNFFSHAAETVARYLAVATAIPIGYLVWLLSVLVRLDKPTDGWLWMLMMLTGGTGIVVFLLALIALWAVILGFGLRSYGRTIANYIYLKKKKDGPVLHFGHLLLSFVLIERSRWMYLWGYLKGWLRPGLNEKRRALGSLPV
jgi:glycosyltransferase involved in cell wall biosynthesis